MKSELTGSGRVEWFLGLQVSFSAFGRVDKGVGMSGSVVFDRGIFDEGTSF